MWKIEKKKKNKTRARFVVNVYFHNSIWTIKRGGLNEEVLKWAKINKLYQIYEVCFSISFKKCHRLFSVNKMFTLIRRRLNNLGAQCFSEKWLKAIKNWDKFHFEVYWLNLLYTLTISFTMIYYIHRLVYSAIIRSNKNAHTFVVLPFWTVALGIQMVLNLVRFSFPVNREHFDIFYVCGNEIDSTK